MADNLAAQHDPVAEYLLEDISRRIEKDETLAKYIFNMNIPSDQIFNHLTNQLFQRILG